ncbi:hypothetical protein K503DRAFT_777493 [Rhizopogon vinicolor AM-OR11-026]|uniref:Uncharacterized protein n=1 Tax=Rhizopogon vinicolor AM-OR11-026 TaxID=1314800 RepID=A0A1B7MG07_9AGAM|nr:hypothetical protein K503DRAFT_777493 [Rhizopogon vinicolor AM-OR11-026]
MPITQFYSTPSSTVNIHPRNLKNSSWSPILADRAVLLIVDVPLAQAGAPKSNSGYSVDEDFDSHPLSPTQNPNSQQPFTAANTNSG